MVLIDGGGHPNAIIELINICDRSELGFSRVCGALIQKRHQALSKGKLDNYFICHTIKDGRKLYEINLLSGDVGIVSIFTIVGDRLILLAIVSFNDILKEALSAQAQKQALQLAEERIDILGD